MSSRAPLVITSWEGIMLVCCISIRGHFIHKCKKWSKMWFKGWLHWVASPYSLAIWCVVGSINSGNMGVNLWYLFVCNQSVPSNQAEFLWTLMFECPISCSPDQKELKSICLNKMVKHVSLNGMFDIEFTPQNKQQMSHAFYELKRSRMTKYHGCHHAS